MLGVDNDKRHTWILHIAALLLQQTLHSAYFAVRKFGSCPILLHLLSEGEGDLCMCGQYAECGKVKSDIAIITVYLILNAS